MKRVILIAVAAVLIGGIAALAVTVTGKIDDLNGEVKSDRGVITGLQSQLAGQQADIAKLNNAMGSLSQPTDPLSAYDQICTAENTNGTTGVLQTYYYPCTNSVQTIPQPGQLDAFRLVHLKQ